MPLIDLAKLDLLDTALFLSFLPVFAGILQGQDTIFVLLGAFASFAFLLKSQDIAAGIALGLVTLRPHWAIALAIPLFFTRRKAFYAFCMAASVLVFYSWLLVGTEGFRGLINSTLS